MRLLVYSEYLGFMGETRNACVILIWKFVEKVPWKTANKENYYIKMDVRKEAVRVRFSSVTNGFAFSGGGSWGSAMVAHIA
jgi:hypothetical protein